MRDFFKILRANQVSVLFSLLLLSMPLMVSAGLSGYVLQNTELIQNFSFIQWGAFFLFTALTMALALTPTTLISLIGGYFLGVASIPFVISSYMLAVLISYFLAKKIDAGRFRHSMIGTPASQKIIHRVKKQEWQAVFFAKISPILPFAFTNYLLAISGVSLSSFLTGSLVGMLPRTLLFIWVGAQMEQLIVSGFDLAREETWIRIAFVILMLFGITGILKVLFTPNSKYQE